MALLRLISPGRVGPALATFLTVGPFVALAPLAACDQARAQPSQVSGLTAPAGWLALPEIATAVGDAMKAGRMRLDGIEAWGEPARGCYGVWLAMHGEGASAQQVLAGLAAENIATADVVRPDAREGLVAVTFDRPPYRGRLRARIAAGRIIALACFANDREPAACERPCTTLLGGLP